MARQALLDAPERPAEDVGIATYESLRESDRRLVLTILVAAAVGPFAPSWQSTARLPFDAHYTVTVHVLGVRKRGAVVQTSSFSTLHPAGLLRPTIVPGDNQTVGIGAPIVFKFKAPVANK